MPDDSFLHEAEQGKWKERPVWMIQQGHQSVRGTTVDCVCSCRALRADIHLRVIHIKTGQPLRSLLQASLESLV